MQKYRNIFNMCRSRAAALPDALQLKFKGSRQFLMFAALVFYDSDDGGDVC